MIRYYNHNLTSPETYKPGDNIIYLGKYDERDTFYPGRIEVIESLIDDNHATLLDRSGVYDISDFAYYDVSLVINDRDQSWISENHYGDYRIRELSEPGTFVSLNALSMLFLDDDHLQTISFDQIQYYGFDEPDRMTGLNCRCCDGHRTRYANIDYPGVILDGTETFSGRRYRSMDGRHRIFKMKHYGYTESLFFVLHLDEIRDYFVPHHFE